MQQTWTDDRIETLRKLWSEGLSTAAIGRELGISKNAVVGKAHRLQLPARPSPIRRGEEEVAEAKKPAEFRGPTCQWPIGDPRTNAFRFCGKPAKAGKPYCEDHCTMAYTRSSNSRAA